jgi:predicted nucleic acid-binding protein
MIVLDTNVVSELMRGSPAPEVVTWIGRQPPAETTTTAITVAEVRYGIGRLPTGRHRRDLLAAADAVFTMFGDKVVAFDVTAAQHYADIVLSREGAGSPISGFDAQIAAICRAHGATLATRNTDDFEGLGLSITNPWRP